jgi:hypothetical protein
VPKRWTRFVLAVSLLALLVPAPPARAQLDACNVGLSPHSVAPSSDTGFSFGFYNPSSDPIAWIQITRPAGDYVALESASAWSWDATVDTDTVTFSNGSLPHAYSQGFSVQALARAATGGPVDWTVQISDDPGGANPITCTDDLSLVIQTQPSVINISNVHVTDVRTTSVKVLWDTDVASNSQVEYGADSSYGSSSTLDSNLVTSHTVTLNGLTPNSGYHYRVTSATPADGGTVTSDDNTFLTATQELPPAPTANPALANQNTTGTVPGVVVQSTPTEHVAPSIGLATDLSKPFRQAPSIAGTASDNIAVARVEYSVNGGRDWLPVDAVTSRNGGQTASFSFTPIVSEDGNYQVVARATDSSGNTTATAPATLVIDRLPPQLGPLIISYGPETLTPDVHGLVHVVAGSDYRLSASSVGGPTGVTLAVNRGTAKTSRTFTLTRSPGSGLWSGLLSLAAGGVYQVVAESADGAGNHTTRTLLTVVVTPPGVVADSSAKPFNNAKLTLYYLEPSTHSWQVWDGAAYDQTNPQTTDQTGHYSLMVPKGEYYLRVTAPRHHAFVSDIFTADRPLALTAAVTLKPLAHIGAITFPDFTWSSQPLEFTQVSAATASSGQTLVNTFLPNFILPTTTGGTQRSIALSGKPTVLTLLTTWSPDSQSQLAALAAVQAKPDINVAPVFSQEHPSLVSTYLATGGYDLTAIIDPDGTLVQPLQIGSLPEHIFVDRTGRIKKVMVGVLSKEELLNQLGGL